MRVNTVFRSIKYGVLFSVLTMVLTFFLRKYFIDSFGKELTGYYLLVNQLIGYLNLAELGLTTASVYLFFKPLNSNDNNEIAFFFHAIKKIYQIIAFGILLLGVAIAVILPYLVKDNIDGFNVFIPWFIFVISTAFSYLYSAETVLLTASEKLYVVKLVTGLSRTLCFLIQILILKVGGSFILFSTIEILYVFIQYCAFKHYISSSYGGFLYNRLNCLGKSHEIRKVITHEVKKTFIHKVSGVLIFNTDYILISIFIGLSTITIYSSYLMFIQATAIILGTIVSPLGASIGNYLHRTNSRITYQKFNTINYCFFILASIGCIIYNNASTHLVQLWMGENVTFSPDVVMLLAINLFCLIARSAVDIFKVAYGYMSDIHLPIIEGTSKLLISLILVNLYGIKGVIYGTIFSNVAIIMLARPWYLYIHAFKLETKTFVKDHFRLWGGALFCLFVLYENYDKRLYTMLDQILFGLWGKKSLLAEFIIHQSIFLIITSLIVVVVYTLIYPELFLIITSILKRKKENESDPHFYNDKK